MRHGGASEDLGMGIRDHAAVKSRGRWFTDQRCKEVCEDRENSTDDQPIVTTCSGVLSMVSCKPGTSLQRVGASKGSLSDKVSSLLGWDDVFAVKLPERFQFGDFCRNGSCHFNVASTWFSVLPY